MMMMMMMVHISSRSSVHYASLTRQTVGKNDNWSIGLSLENTERQTELSLGLRL